MTNNEQTRITLLNQLVKADGDIAELEKGLANFEWDFEGEPVILDKPAVKNVLSRFIEGKLTAEMVESWAEALELREDIDYPEQQEEIVSEIMHVLANPTLEGALTVQKAQELISKL